MIKAEIDIDQIKQKRATDIRIMKDRATTRILGWTLPSIILLFAGLVFSIIYIEDAAMIAIIASATSSTSMALISILTGALGIKDKESDLVKANSALSQLLDKQMDYNHREKSKSTELVLDDKAIKVVDGNIKAAVSNDILYGKDEKPKR